MQLQDSTGKDTYIVFLIHAWSSLDSESVHYFVWWQNVKGVFDTAIKVVLQPPRRKEVASRKKRHSSGCSIV